MRSSNGGRLNSVTPDSNAPEVPEGCPCATCPPCPTIAPTLTPEPPLLLRAITIGIDAGIGSIGADIGSSLATGEPLEADDLISDFAGGFVSGFLTTILISTGLNSTAAAFLSAVLVGFIFAERPDQGTDDSGECEPCSGCPCNTCPRRSTIDHEKRMRYAPAPRPVRCPWQEATR